MNKVKLHDLEFVPYLSEADILARVQELGTQLAADYSGRTPCFLVVLKGAAIFAADLIRATGIPCELTFIELASYEGTASSGAVRMATKLPQRLSGKDVIVVEDIIDTGRTMHFLLPQLEAIGAKSTAIATLLHKPDAQQFDLDLQYVGFEIPNDFVVGYGLDYEQHGRELSAIYVKK
ncbi:MAG: hypoxanthine phosphoribosyltransferase [Bacteroidota bacterium]